MILCGTGHRPNKLGGYGQDVFDRLVALAERHLLELIPELVISGMALGWDQALAQAAVNLKIPFHAYIPFAGQEGRWPKQSQQLFYQLRVAADKRIHTSDGGYAPYKMQMRNRRMVDASSLVLALWDGSSGGTANCVAYASKTGTEILNIWDEWNESPSSV